ncbi:MAG TPA: citrate lyase subunit alpha [Thermoplasmatales archaeon]|nr:citrate lyase subunit alpha [Thermoplasmatales archaeon]HEB37226.1 citrate lyase subunit alpha [Thermoplasmatales archaeon]
MRSYNKYERKSKIVDLKTALKKSGIKDGCTISFHHQLRNGDYVVNTILEVVRELDIKDIRLAQTALFNIHEPVIDYIKEGIVTRIEGSINGVVGDYVSKHPLRKPVVLRSHGRRWADVKNGNLKVDIAIIAASAADEVGNATGIIGKSAFGPIVYSQIDATMAKKVIVITDNIVEYPCPYQEIKENYVDYVCEVSRIGDPNNIIAGSTKITTDPVKQEIAHKCIELMDAAGIIKNGMTFQSGAGGISLAATKYLGEKLEEKDIIASLVMGGVTKYMIDIYESGRAKLIYYAQCFDTYSVEYISKNPSMPIMDIGQYADPTAKSRSVDSLDTVVLGATEVDTKFNVNVNTHSDGRLLHGIGGHQDTAAGAYLTIITVPLYRKTNPIVREKVTTITTPGNVVDAIVTYEGIAINPRRKDIIKKLEGKIEILPIEKLKEMAYSQTGEPAPLDTEEEIVAEIRWLDGSTIDRVYKIKEE